MAIANLHETLLTYTMRIAELNLEISQLQSEKNLAIYKQSDRAYCKAQDEEAVRNYFKALYDENPDYGEIYIDYTQIPDFEEEMDKIAAEYSDENAELTAWETALDEQITVDSAELEEVKAYKESIKSMLQSNIQEDFSYAGK